MENTEKVNEYNSALFKICSQLKYYVQEVNDEDMLEKTYSTFHTTNITLTKQYRVQNFTRYSKLNACLLVVHQNNEHLMKTMNLHFLKQILQILMVIKTIHVADGVVVVEDEVVVILIETKSIIRTIIWS
uniref:Uncharacterized protein n=1 Tax=Lactuca sativa TaxID=4236 RepID=A0A9R1VH60_LACSA|nr:hypothetical protein LSAT_V11C500252570 [Lactuca sativa]